MNHYNSIISIVLAAGQGKRMNSTLPKVAHLLAGKPLIIWVMESLMGAGIYDIIPVISPTQTLLKEIVMQKPYQRANIHFAYQNEQLGTAHAVNCGVQQINEVYQNESNKDLKIIVAYGDTPQIKSETFKKLLISHENNLSSFTILAFMSKNPYGYGRILTDENGEFIAIREEKDCSLEEKDIQICNSGILCANYTHLIEILPQIKNNNSAKEYYLTDIPFYAKKHNMKIGLIVEDDEQQFFGINTQEQLAAMEKLITK